MTNSLDSKLNQIKSVFDVKSILEIKPDKEYIRKYYKANQLAYSIFHTFSDRMYMGISRDGIYKEYDLLEAARIVERYINKLGAKNVLELATGRGATSSYLASKYPKIQFDGIELSPGQIVYAQRKAKKLKNYFPVLGDYHNLSKYKKNSIDIVFVIEALCYSTEKEKVLAEIKRVLRKDGVFIILDGYTRADRKKLTKAEQLACKLVEIGMAVENFETYSSFLKKAKKYDFTILEQENASLFIMPTLKRFERLARTFFKSQKVAKLLSKVLSKEFIYNNLSGYLMPDLTERNIACYYITVFQNESSK